MISKTYLMRHLHLMIKSCSSSGSDLMAWSRYSIATSAEPLLSSYMPYTFNVRLIAFKVRGRKWKPDWGRWGSHIHQPSHLLLEPWKINFCNIITCTWWKVSYLSLFLLCLTSAFKSLSPITTAAFLAYNNLFHQV